MFEHNQVFPCTSFDAGVGQVMDIAFPAKVEKCICMAGYLLNGSMCWCRTNAHGRIRDGRRTRLLERRGAEVDASNGKGDMTVSCKV